MPNFQRILSCVRKLQEKLVHDPHKVLDGVICVDIEINFTILTTPSQRPSQNANHVAGLSKVFDGSTFNIHKQSSLSHLNFDSFLEFP